MDSSTPAAEQLSEQDVDPSRRVIPPALPPAAEVGSQLLYRATLSVALPFLLPLLAWHPRLRGGLADRFGWGGPIPAAGAVWLHGASAGDVVALAPIARRLQQEDRPHVVSTWTRAGHQMAERRLTNAARIFRAPLDLAGPVRRTLDRLQPRLLLLECLELWPFLISACRQRGVPVAVVNGRLSATSLRRYEAWPALFRPCFSGLAMVAALTAEDAGRFEAAGVPPRRITVAPTSKHAGVVLAPMGTSPSRKLVLGSLHRPEERSLLPWIKRLLEEVPDLKVVVAPRYPHRAGALVRRLVRLGMPAARASRRPEAGVGRVAVVDQMGALAAEYRGARAAFIGGSLCPRGGHNLLEPAAVGAPVLFGPHTDNCRSESETLRELRGGHLVTSGEDFYQRSRLLLMEEEVYQRARRAALTAAERITRASNRGIQQIMDFIGGGGDGLT